MHKVREFVPVPLATGERDRTIWEVREILEAQVIDILQPDCGHGGGITQMVKVAALAEAHHVPIAPHCTMSYLGLTASLHVAASVPFFLIHEGYKNQLPTDAAHPQGIAHKTWEMDEEGYVSLPEGPGLGVEVDEALAREIGADPDRVRPFEWPNARHRDGAVADY
jgi:galactonate dehydratase